MQQTPSQLWAHRNELTPYQVWVHYRIAVRQLNLFHAGRPENDCCHKLQRCQETKETIEHIFWECPCAKACWQQLIQHWTGEQWEQNRIQRFQNNCASTKAPEISTVITQRLKIIFPDEEDEFTAQWKRMWSIMCNICTTCLWMQRNRVVFQHAEVTIASSVQEFWTTGIRQLKAIAKRERRRPDRLEQGTRLLLCQAQLERNPQERPPPEASHEQPLDQQEPTLLARLRINQTSSRR